MSNKKRISRAEILAFAVGCAENFKHGRLSSKFEGITEASLASAISSSIQYAFEGKLFKKGEVEVIEDVESINEYKKWKNNEV